MAEEKDWDKRITIRLVDGVPEYEFETAEGISVITPPEFNRMQRALKLKYDVYRRQQALRARVVAAQSRR